MDPRGQKWIAGFGAVDGYGADSRVCHPAALKLELERLD